MADARTTTEVKGGPTLALLIAWLVSYFAVRLLLESNPGMSSSTRLAMSFLPTPLFALFLWRFIRGIRGADELERPSPGGIRLADRARQV